MAEVLTESVGALPSARGEFSGDIPIQRGREGESERGRREGAWRRRCPGARRWVMLLLATCCVPALAQNDTPDAASIPTTSVGQGGADRDTQEQDEAAAVSCLSDRDCDHGFHCVGRRCVYQRYRDATFEGCGRASPTALSGGLGVGLPVAVAWSLRLRAARRARR